jgi:lipopolysaccharide transport system ATP-binding protein
MSSDTVIRVENLSKKYVIRHTGSPRNGDGLRHAIQDAASAPWRRIKKRFETDPAVNGNTAVSQASAFEEFYALTDVSFDVRRGEVLGIIGRNGAGKSTLLKILSRITEPTRGRIGIKGRVASLLEVGTGFHAELTGRENIFLNGAILGMKRNEIARKFDEIVAFAAVERFLDTPVKHYSSGMYVRLAFAVAAHLEAEIMVVDEVLAVGDAEFQKKCLGKMKDVAGGGRTVLFVSHNMSAVTALCGTGIQLDGGRIRANGHVDMVMKSYINGMAKSAQPASRRNSSGKARQIISIIPRSQPCAARAPIIFDVSVSRSRDGAPCHFSIHINNEEGVNVATVSTEHLNTGMLQGNIERFSIQLDHPLLLPGGYSIDAFLHCGGIIDSWACASYFDVSDSLATAEYSSRSNQGCKLVLSSFEINTVS